MSTSDNDQSQSDERRQHARMSVHWQGSLAGADEAEDCFVLDISSHGARVQCASPFDGQDYLTLRLKQGESHSAMVVWRQGSFMGLRFADGDEPKLAA